LGGGGAKKADGEGGAKETPDTFTSQVMKKKKRTPDHGLMPALKHLSKIQCDKDHCATVHTEVDRTIYL